MVLLHLMSMPVTKLEIVKQPHYARYVCHIYTTLDAVHSYLKAADKSTGLLCLVLCM